MMKQHRKNRQDKELGNSIFHMILVILLHFTAYLLHFYCIRRASSTGHFALWPYAQP